MGRCAADLQVDGPARNGRRVAVGALTSSAAMAAQKNVNATLTIEPRESLTSGAPRRLRRAGRVPGVLYGLGDDCLCFSVDARELRHALHGAGAVLELSGDGTGTTPAVLK